MATLRYVIRFKWRAMHMAKRLTALLMAFLSCLGLCLAMPVRAVAAVEITAPSAILIESSTGTVIFEKNADERRSPASITKIMTLLITLEYVKEGKADLKDEVLVSENAASMGGSQVYLAQGEVQTLETLLKCIAVSSGNDASVAVAEYVAGSEEAFVKMMNDKAASLGMTGTHFVDCCGLSDSDDHYTTARDVSIMARALTQDYPEVFQYTQIWMEDITHVTRQGTTLFTLSSTNKLLKRYPYCTGLKTGSTQKAKYCMAATATKDGIDLIAVVMGAPDPKTRFSEAQTLLTYGYASCKLYRDEEPLELPEIPVRNGIQDSIALQCEDTFSYLDLEGLQFSEIKREVELPEQASAPIKKGEIAGRVRYLYRDMEIGSMPITYAEDLPKAGFGDYLKYCIQSWLFS